MWRSLNHAKLAENPRGLTTQIQDPPDRNVIVLDRVIYCIGKSSAYLPVVAKNAFVNSGIQDQGINLGIQRIKEITPDVGLLGLIKFVARLKIAFSDFENADFHRSEMAARILSLASLQLENVAFPSS